MRTVSFARRAVLASTAALVAATVWTAPAPGLGSGAGAATQSTLAGEGGDAVGPIMSKLLKDDTAGLAPDFGSYTNVDLDQGITDFVGTAPNTFGTDFAVTERPLTTAEAAAAKANGRSYAYVPFAASPVALMTLVPDAAWGSGPTTTIQPDQYCQHIPLTLTQLDGIFGAPAFTSWGDSALSCTSPPNSPADGASFQLWANADPTMETEALMTLLDSTTASQSAFQAGLNAAHAGGEVATTDPTPSEHWPYTGTVVTGGDQATLGKVVGLDPQTGAPSPIVANLKLGAIMPIADDWTGDPLGVTWDLPTAAVQDAAGAFVTPSAASAKAAENDATLAATSDPTTNNLVTFSASTSDSAAYNNDLMMESYLLVPTKGLSADKAQALAQFIRFAVGGTGAADITALGAAPATSAMVTADLAVAQQLDAEAAAAPSATTTTTTTTTSGSTSSTTTSTTTTAASATSANSPSTGSTSPSSTGGLAFTGGNPVPLVALGLALLVCGEVARQALRRRKARG
jgi:ABC-type phosphate transport system substrate-binding protein